MQVKCYDCGRLVSSGEAVKQNERDGRARGGSYGKHGWGVETGSWKSAGKSYWLCIERNRRRAENCRFWQWLTIGVVLGLLLLALIIGLVIGRQNN